MAGDGSLRRSMIEAGKEVAAREAVVAAEVAGLIGDDFGRAAELLLACRGRVVCAGLGKSGIIARKLAASLSSLGTPALFVHAAEALHGDLGMVAPGDVAVLLSHSGATPEVCALLEPLRELGTPIVALTDHLDSPLGRGADVVLCPGVTEEADHLGLAPTASTTAALVMTDALAVAVARERGFTAEHFARTHPGGSLGRDLSRGRGRS